MGEERTPDAKALAEELERTRAMLVQAAKMAELGKQVASLIHEINQPLMGIKAFAQMLKTQLEGNEAAQRRAAFIEEQAVVLEKLTARLRRYSRKAEASTAEVAGVPEVAQSVVRMLAHRLRKVGVEVKFDLAPELPKVKVGPVHLQQLLVNLLTNAADALDGRPEKRIRVHGERDNGMVRVWVADSGDGIPDEVREKIFEPFFTTKGEERGTGLGLPICLEIVKGHGGSLLVRSGPDVAQVAGDGMRTLIEVVLPAADE